jgi:chromosome segregation ATPase
MTEIESLLETVSAMRDTIAAKEALIADLKARCAELTESLAASEAENARQAKFIDLCSVVHNHNVKLKGKLTAAEARCAELEARLAAAEQEMRKTHRKCENMIWARDAAEARCVELTKRLLAADRAYELGHADGCLQEQRNQIAAQTRAEKP